MAKPRVAAIIQARMGSTRLPGKVLMPLAGKPVLWHIVHRLRKCRMVDVVAIATSDKLCDDPLVEFARDEGVELIRGPEDNVLQRYALAAEKLDPDYIVRVTGDAPLIDPETIDLLVREMISQNADYCLGESQRPTIHEGFDPFSRRALDKLLRDVSDDPVAREHVTAYFKSHPDFIKIARVPLPKGFEIEGVRTSVDTPADLEFLEILYQRLRFAPGELELRQAVKLLQQEPKLKEINCHVRQKNATDQSRFIIIRCDGDSQIGLGHVTRCLVLAHELRNHHSWGVLFAVSSGTIGVSRVREELFPVTIKPDGISEDAWLESLVIDRHPDALLFDIRTDLGRNALERLKGKGPIIIVLDDNSDRRLVSDLAFYPPVPQAFRLQWPHYAGRALIGWEWILIKEDYYKPHPSPRNSTPRILVTMGGSDPANLTLLAIEALELVPDKVVVALVLGPAFAHDAEISASLSKSKQTYEIYRNLPGLAEVAATVDFGIVAFGGTAYELAALGVLTILIGLTEDHAESAQCLDSAGLAINLGEAFHVAPAMLAETVSKVLQNPARGSKVHNKARKLFHIPGAQNIARAISETAELMRVRRY
ncbi:cytidylyltransferase domain-containing protein [Desulfuromonas acetexigens]|nr:NTP transferase domain-containing protein [Desulfuromonas acetexigens]